MGGVVSDVANAVTGGLAGAIGGAVDAVTGGIGSAVGGVTDALGLPSVFGDALESFAGIGLGIATGGIGGLGGLGIIGEAAGFLDPLGFLGGAGDFLGGFSDILNPSELLGNLMDPGFDFMGALGGLAGNIFGAAEGITDGTLDLFSSILPGSIGDLLPAVRTGAEAVLGSVLGMFPQAGGLLGGLPDLGSNLLKLAENFNPTDVLNGLQQGLGKLADLFPSPSNQLTDLLSKLLNFTKGGVDPSSLLKEIAGQLQNVPELGVPMMPFEPSGLLHNINFMQQFLNYIGDALTQPVQTMPGGFNPLGPLPIDLSRIPIMTPPLLMIDPNIIRIIQDAIGPVVGGGVPGGPATTPGAPAAGGAEAPAEGGVGGDKALVSAFEKNMDSINGIQDEIMNLDPEDPDYQKKMMQLQLKMNQLQEMQSMILDMLKKQHEMRMEIIRKLGGN